MPIRKFAGGLDTSDADAISADILVGKTAYVNGSKITGTFVAQASITTVSVTTMVEAV